MSTTVYVADALAVALAQFEPEHLSFDVAVDEPDREPVVEPFCVAQRLADGGTVP